MLLSELKYLVYSHDRELTYSVNKTSMTDFCEPDCCVLQRSNILIVQCSNFNYLFFKRQDTEVIQALPYFYLASRSF